MLQKTYAKKMKINKISFDLLLVCRDFLRSFQNINEGCAYEYF